MMSETTSSYPVVNQVQQQRNCFSVAIDTKPFTGRSFMERRKHKHLTSTVWNNKVVIKYQYIYIYIYTVYSYMYVQ